MLKLLELYLLRCINRKLTKTTSLLNNKKADNAASRQVVSFYDCVDSWGYSGHPATTDTSRQDQEEPCPINPSLFRPMFFYPRWPGTIFISAGGLDFLVFLADQVFFHSLFFFFW